VSVPDTTPDDLRLPRQPGVIQQFWARHAVLADWLIAVFWGFPAALITLVSLLQSAHYTTGSYWWAFVGTLLVIASCAGVYLRRARPILAFAVLCLALVPAPFTEASPSQILPAFGVYSLAVYRSNGAAWIGAAAVEIVSTLYLWAAAPFSSANTIGHNPAQWAPFYAIELLIALAIGATIGNRRRYLAALIDRARQLARERDQQAQLAAVAERARIARDMHDVVSHSLTVMITLAEGSAAAAGADAERAATVMRQVADTGREALTGMRQMLGVLGADGPAEFAPQPTAADVPQLVERFHQMGLPVTLRTEGEVPAEPALQVAVYRIVQESLTNALRYAHGPTSVGVVIDAAGDPIAVVVEDDGLPGMPTPSVGARQGLIGLHERVTALGGTLATGRRDSGSGWRVAAALPLPGADPTTATVIARWKETP
jgi:signal transduction histidine kinase